jgi:hypothetical protein
MEAPLPGSAAWCTFRTSSHGPHVREATFVTDGLAILAAWLMFGALLVALAAVVLTGGPKT